MRCLVLGGAGFIGSHVVEALVAANHEVQIFSRRPNQFWSPPSSVACTWADWNDLNQLEASVAEADAVVHLLGSSTPAISNANMARDVEHNLIGTINLLNLCCKHQVRKVVFASSGGTVYGVPAEVPIPETSETNPITSYGIVKLAIEKYLELFHRLYGLDYIVLRASNAYGERQNLHRSQGAVGVFMDLIHRAKQIELWGDGSVVRDYLYVGDLAAAFKLATESSVACGVFNAGSGRGVSLNQLIEELREVTGINPSISYLPARPFDVPANVLDTELIKNTFDWQPETELREGLARTWKWLQSL